MGMFGRNTLDIHKPFALHVSDDGLLVRKSEVQAIIAEFDNSTHGK